MAHIRLNSDAVLHITKQTIVEIMKAIDKAEKARGMAVQVESQNSHVKFYIDLEESESEGFIPLQVFYKDRESIPFSEDLL